ARVAAGGVVDSFADRLVLERAAQLVGGDAVNRAVARGVPQRVLILLGFERRIGVKNLAVGAVVVRGRVEQVLVQRLAVDRQAFAARLGDGGNAGGGGDVHHVERGAGHAFGQAKHAAEAEVL